MVSFDESPRVFTGAEGSALTASVAASLAASKLRLCTSLDEMLRMAVELARESLGLERVAFYLRDPELREPRAERVVLCGTWGTGAQGETTDERHLSHELSVSDGAALQKLRATGACSLYRPRARWYAADPEGAVLLGEGWVMVTPLLHEGDLVGVMYNDAALTGSPINPSQQAAAALLATFVSIEYGARVGPIRWQPLRCMEAPSAFVRKIRDAVDRDLSMRGNELAQAFGVSAGYLARAFKREMGLSLVEYRNRKRIDRFWQALEQHGRDYSLKQAAFEAAFGSYAQFNRVHKQLVGEGPRRNVPRTQLFPPLNTPPKTSTAPWPPNEAEPR